VGSNTPRVRSQEEENSGKGKFFYYRVRAQNFAGTYSEWSDVSKGAATALPKETLTEVSNYPNPVDFRKGQTETYLTYVLNDDVDEVVITLYDLLGYKVYEWRPPKGDRNTGGKSFVNGTGKGAAKGTNVIVWDGKNAAGQPVAKGGYVMHIKAGNQTQIRKIGIVR
jgi:hypothetical protein